MIYYLTSFNNENVTVSTGVRVLQRERFLNWLIEDSLIATEPKSRHWTTLHARDVAFVG